LAEANAYRITVHQVISAPRILSMNTTHAILGPGLLAGNIYLIAFFRTVSSITFPFASSIQAL
jgi:hypothetical protein